MSTAYQHQGSSCQLGMICRSSSMAPLQLGTHEIDCWQASPAQVWSSWPACQFAIAPLFSIFFLWFGLSSG